MRTVGARKSLLEVPDDVETFREHTTPFYDVFPNTVLVYHPIWVSLLTLWPTAVDEVRMVHRMLVPPASAGLEELERSYSLIDERVFDVEDLAIAASIQSTLDSGANRHVTVGGLEEGMRLFHQARDAALEEV